MIRLLVLLLCLFIAPHANAQPTGCTTTTCTGSALPSGYLTVSGNQFQNNTTNVRLACAEFQGTPNDGSMLALRNAGFNCIRLGWRDAYIAAASTWNPSDAINITFSNGNKTATTPAANTTNGVRSISARGSGSYCWAVTAGTIRPNWVIGIANLAWSLGAPSTTNSIDYVPGGGNSVYTGGTRLTGGDNSSVSGEEMDLCANLGSRLLYVSSPTMVAQFGAGSWNNSVSCNPTVAACGLAFNMSGPYFLHMTDNGDSSSAVGTVNTTGPFTNSILATLPSGYTAWDTPASPPAGCNSLSQISTCVSNATTNGLAVVLDHRGNEAVASSSSCWITQQNGLWYDVGGISVGADGCGNNGNITSASFQNNWLALASAFAGNSTVIGAELDQNPLVYGATGTRATTGGGGGGGTGSFTINSGGQIVDPNGAVFVARGIAIDYENVNAGNVPLSKLQGFFPRINYIRLTNFLGGGYTDGITPGTIETWIDQMTALGIVVQLSDYGNTGNCRSGSDLANAGAWETQWASHFAGNPYIWWATENECYDTSGGSAASFQTQLISNYNAIRAGAPNAIISLEAAGGGPGPAWFYYYPSSNITTWTNVTFGPHNYYVNLALEGVGDDPSSIHSALAGYVSSYHSSFHSANEPIIPVIATEQGENNTPNAQGQVDLGNTYADDATAALTTSDGTGYAGWAYWEWGCGCEGNTTQFTLVSNGVLISPFGPHVQGYMAAAPGTGPTPPTGGGGGGGATAACTAFPTANSCSLSQSQLNTLVASISSTMFSEIPMGECFIPPGYPSGCVAPTFLVGDTIVTTATGLVTTGNDPVSLTDGAGNVWTLQSGQACAPNSADWWWAGIALNGVQQWCGYAIAIRKLNNGDVYVEEAKGGGWWDLTVWQANGHIGRPNEGGDPGPGPNNASAGAGAIPIPLTWAGGGTNNSDILQMCSTVGSAINAANSGMVIFCPGPINGSGGTLLLNGVTKPTDCTNISDLSNAGAHAMTGFPVNKMAYAAHFYPVSINGTGCVDSGSTLAADLNAYFGYLEVTGRAPVAVLEMGCSCDGLVGNATDENAWGAAFTSYLNGMTSGGPTFVGTTQPISWNWWAWSNPQSQTAGLNPDGIRNPNNTTLNVGQQDWWSTLLYAARNVTITTTWNPSDETAIVLSNNNNTATSSTTTPNGVRSTTSKGSGLYCWAVTATTIQPNWVTGLANGSWSLGARGTANSIDYVPAGGQAVYTNNVFLTGGSSSSVSGEEMDLCANLNAQLLYVSSPTMVTASGAGSWNNSNTCTPTVAACGISFAGMTGPYFIHYTEATGESPAVAVLNTTGPFANSVLSSLPTGYSTWDQATTAGTGRPVINILGTNDNGTRFALAR